MDNEKRAEKKLDLILDYQTQQYEKLKKIVDSDA